METVNILEVLMAKFEGVKGRTAPGGEYLHTTEYVKWLEERVETLEAHVRSLHAKEIEAQARATRRYQDDNDYLPWHEEDDYR